MNHHTCKIREQKCRKLCKISQIRGILWYNKSCLKADTENNLKFVRE